MLVDPLPPPSLTPLPPSLPPSEIPASTLKRFNGGEEAVAALTSGEMIRSDDLLAVGEVPMQDGDRDAQFFTLLRGEMLDLAHDPALSLVELSAEDRDAYGGMKFIKVFASTKFKNNPKVRSECIVCCTCTHMYMSNIS